MTSKSLVSSLTEAEWLLLAETKRAVLADLDEDELLTLHTRVRRARTKYVTQYRRAASARVADVGGRGAARPKNRRAADKAEAFEKALARVSTALAAAARTSAVELRTLRLATARDKGGTGPDGVVDDMALAPPRAKGKGRAASTRTPIARKNVAATKASGARRQAKRDSR
ncbi:MAG: hypothetical protein H0X35_10140 [Pseudonocardiales bacterium]|nr:hypothetical protein [Pseudonocardiales bacterium]